MTPKEILQQRGIYEASLKLGWTEGANYWEFPLFDLDGNEIAKRGKAYPNQNLPKYIWPDGKPKNPASDYYIPKGTLEAIREADGVCYLANGETALAAFHAAGIYNVIATPFSEVTVPKTLLETLEKLGVKLLINIADKDKAGIKAAQNWRDALRDSGIEYQAKQWPDYLAEKSDFNDLWMHHAFDREAVLIALDGCQALILPQPEVKTPKVITEKDKTPQGLIDLIASHFGIQQWDSEGFSRKNVFCPFHDDKTKESAGFNQISGVLNCFACGAHSPKAVAEQLGIRWQDYYPKKERVKKPLAPDFSAIPDSNDKTPIDPNKRDYWTGKRPKKRAIITDLDTSSIVWQEKPSYINTAWIEQDELPLSWEKALLQVCHSKSASPVYAIRFHHAIREGRLNGEKMSLKEIMAVLESPRLSTQSFVDFLLSLNYLWILDTKYLEESINTESINKSRKKGRPTIYYALNTHTDSLSIALAERLEPILIERLSEDLERAPRSHTMREALDLSLEEYQAWAKRTNTAKHEYILELVSERITDVLTNTASLSFTEKDLEHPQNLRGKLLKMSLEPYSERTVIDSMGNTIVVPRVGIQLSKAKLTLELGCSKGTITKLFEVNNIGHQRIYAWHEVTRPNGCDIEKEIREAAYNLNKDMGGRAFALYLRYFGQVEKLPLFYDDGMKAIFDKHNGRIANLQIRVEQPSLLWNMTADEIAHEATKQAKLASQALDSADSPEERAIVLEKLEKKAKERNRKPSMVAGCDETITGHNPDWLRKEIEQEMKDFSAYILKGLSIVNETTGEIITSLKGLKEVVVWLNHYEPKPMPIVLKAVAPKPLPVVEKPKPIIKSAENYDGWCWANHPDEFRERMLAIGAKA